MKTKGLLRIVVLFFCVIGFSGCNDDESEFSSTEIQQALFEVSGFSWLVIFLLSV